MTDEAMDAVLDAVSDVLIGADLEIVEARDVLIYLLCHTLQQMLPEYDAGFAEGMGMAVAEGYRACCSTDTINANITFQ